LNLDPRSFYLNTEVGMFIDSPGLAVQVVEWFERVLGPENSWVVSRDEKGKLVWTSAYGTRHKEKARSGGQKFKTRLAGLATTKKQL
jgi:putative cardiolipin synthase